MPPVRFATRSTPRARSRLAAIDERDRDFGYPSPGTVRQPRHLDEKCVAFRDDLAERELREERPAPAPEAAGAVGHREPRDRADVTIGEAAQDTPAQRPVLQPSARDVARADHEVCTPRRLDETWDVRRIVRQVGIHLTDVCGSRVERHGDAVDVRAAEAAGGRPMEDGDPIGVERSKPLGLTLLKRPSSR